MLHLIFDNIFLIFIPKYLDGVDLCGAENDVNTNVWLEGCQRKIFNLARLKNIQSQSVGFNRAKFSFQNYNRCLDRIQTSMIGVRIFHLGQLEVKRKVILKTFIKNFFQDHNFVDCQMCQILYGNLFSGISPLHF